MVRKTKLTTKARRSGLQAILAIVKLHKADLIVVGILSVFTAAADSVIPYISGRLIDALISKREAFLGLIAVWAVLKLIADVLTWQINARSDLLTENIESGYIADSYGKLLFFPMSFHKNRKVGDIMNRIERAGGRMTNLINGFLVQLAPQFLSIVFALVFTLFVEPRLAVFLVIGAVLYGVIVGLVTPKLSKLLRKMHAAYNRAYSNAYDVILNVGTVKQAAAETYESRKIKRNLSGKAVSLWADVVKLQQYLGFSQQFLISSVQFAIFLTAFYLISAGSLTVGQLVMFNAYAAMLFGPLAFLGRNWNLLQDGLIAIARAEKALSESPEVYVPKDAVILSTVKGSIEFRDVSFAYEKKKKEPVLDGVSVTIHMGESVALVGESGVGKSTFADLVSAFYFPTKGEILIDGHSTETLDLMALRSEIAIVPQEVALFNDTIRNNIKYGRFGASDKVIRRAAELSHASEFIDKFPKGYKQVVGERGVKLSVGQKQRIAIARAILRDPKILILDEPTSALDAKSEKFIEGSLTELMKGRTTLIIAHRLSTVRHADKILVLDKGKVIEAGRHEELVQIPDGAYRRLYELQVGLV